jgi:HrpA-like RNA helicase
MGTSVSPCEQAAAADTRIIADSGRMLDDLNARYSPNATPELKKIIAQRMKLPSWAKTAELLQAVANHQVTIVAGETGCGKTTQLPQFILDEVGLCRLTL